MRDTLSAIGRSGSTACLNAGLAMALMLLMEYGMSGQWHLARPYLWAGALIGLVVFVGQLFRQYRLCRDRRITRNARTESYQRRTSL
ncbi:hypothetical protein CF392_12885 [Tamilnaduibacter salinus]|uniref:Uncharacterized protein n=1 Tax=Tamilnaduibacter salinus TaxID=1484056 RepID=A0A2A2I1A5_9GAMM|nr:hypothetical protein CF392_12885 [Tamilnaduibacter salinus]